MKTKTDTIPLHKLSEFEKFYLNNGTELPSLFKAQLHKGGTSYFSIFLRTENPCKSEIDINRSEFYKILLITRGSGILHYGTGKYQIEPNSLLFLKPTEVKSWQATTKEQEGFYCIFTEQFFAFNPAHLRDLKMNSLFAPGASPVLQLTLKQLNIVHATLKKLYEEFSEKNTFNEDLCRLYLHVLLIESKRFLQGSPTNNYNSSAPFQLTQKFFELLENEFSKATLNGGIKLRFPADFAEKLFVHTNYLNACVRKITDKTVHEHIRDRMLSEAQLLLTYTDLNIAQIADKLGFKEATHFTSIFKKATRITPVKYREAKATDRN